MLRQLGDLRKERKGGKSIVRGGSRDRMVPKQSLVSHTKKKKE